MYLFFFNMFVFWQERVVQVEVVWNAVKIRRDYRMLFRFCAYAGTWNLVQVNSLLEHIDKNETHLSPVALGIAMIAMVEKEVPRRFIESLKKSIAEKEAACA